MRQYHLQWLAGEHGDLQVESQHRYYVSFSPRLIAHMPTVPRSGGHPAIRRTTRPAAEPSRYRETGHRPARASPQMAGPAITPVRPLIDAWLSEDPPPAPTQIWKRLVDDHDVDIAYGTVAQYTARPTPHLTGQSAGKGAYVVARRAWSCPMGAPAQR